VVLFKKEDGKVSLDRLTQRGLEKRLVLRSDGTSFLIMTRDIRDGHNRELNDNLNVGGIRVFTTVGTEQD